MNDAPPPRRIVVTRPEPPSDEPDPKSPPKLSKDEVRALLAVTKVRSSPTKRALKRVGILSIPTTIVGIALDLAFGEWGTLLVLVIIAAGIFWSVRPLFAKERNDW